MERLPLFLSLLCFLAAFAQTMYRLGAGRHRTSRGNLGLMAAGFAGQTWFLFLRGEVVGRCPLGSFGDMMVFLAWSTVLLYLAVGPAYRLSLLGTFTAPLVLCFQSVGLVVPLPGERSPGPVEPWVELHAALSVISYGAFALAGVAGVMLLIQERHLKRHSLGGLFYHLPPIPDLGGAIRRLMLAGFALLSAGLAAGFVAGRPEGKTWVGVAVWALYGAILQAAWRRRLGPRASALLAVGAFGASLLSLFLMSLWMRGH
jgi:ABC-type uncharacterized transport system permease subunit